MRSLLAVLVVALLAGCQERSAVSPTPAAPALTVSTLTARWQDMPEQLELSGNFQPVREATLSTRLSGRITRLSVDEGDRVQAGEVVAQVDTSDVEARIEQARSGRQAAMRRGAAACSASPSTSNAAKLAVGKFSTTARAKRELSWLWPISCAASA